MTTTVPPAVAYVRDLLHGFDAPWILCGGWAADAWLGRTTRNHWDVDIAVFHHDQRALFDHLTGWALVAHDPNAADDTTEPWTGRHLDPPAHIHAPTLAGPLATSPTARHTDFEFEFLLIERSGHDWVLHTQPHIAVPLDRATQQSIWGLTIAAPEIVLFYKALNESIRLHDERDLQALLPTLTETQRTWLRDALAKVQFTHPWLPRLAA